MTATGDGWRRVHPASPFVRGWVALAALFFFFGRDAFERLLRGEPVFDERFAERAPWVLIGGSAVLLMIVLGYVLTWYFTRYQVGDGYVRVNTGFLFKQQRQARLDRVQAIDVVQPLLARIFGLAELRFDVADAGKAAVHLAYLRIGEAKELRATILAQAAGGAPGPAQPGEPGQPGQPAAAAALEAPEQAVLTVPPSRLAGSLVLSEQSVVIVLGAAASVLLSAVTENRGFYFYLIPAGLGLIAAYWKSFTKGYNFTAAVSPDGIRLRYGLLDTQAQTLPPGRIQALRVSQPPLWRIFGWYRIQVNVAGYGTEGSQGQASSRTTLLPVGTLPEVLGMLALVLPDPGTPDPVRVYTAGLNGFAPAAGSAGRAGASGGPAGSTTPDDGGFVTTPRRARLLAPLTWRRNGFTATDTALLIRSGRWWRHLVLVPHQRTQSMSLQQGPLARRFAVVDLVLHTTAGPVAPRLIQAGLDEGRALLDAQAARARTARQRQRSEHWLARAQHLEHAPTEGPQHA
ncbi:MAG: PH domain-containing protein [Arthrobacter sp.]|nr:PH domain-containing protein [Arthrobacter sp.]